MVLPSSYIFTIKHGETEVLLPDVPSASTVSTSQDLPPGEVKDVEPFSTAPLLQDHTYFQNVSTSAETKQKREPSKQMPSLSVGYEVIILKNQEPIGTGIIADGELLHGRVIPGGYIKLIVKQVMPNVTPIFRSAFDEEEEALSAGQFIAWPENEVKLP